MTRPCQFIQNSVSLISSFTTHKNNLSWSSLFTNSATVVPLYSIPLQCVFTVFSELDCCTTAQNIKRGNAILNTGLSHQNSCWYFQRTNCCCSFFSTSNSRIVQTLPEIFCTDQPSREEDTLYLAWLHWVPLWGTPCPSMSRI